VVSRITSIVRWMGLRWLEAMARVRGLQLGLGALGRSDIGLSF
jgi:hypothetical protein